MKLMLCRTMRISFAFVIKKTIGDQKKKNQNPENEEREIMEYDDYGITMIHVKDLMFSIQISHL